MINWIKDNKWYTVLIFLVLFVIPVNKEIVASALVAGVFIFVLAAWNKRKEKISRED